MRNGVLIAFLRGVTWPHVFTFRGISAFLLAKAQAKGPDGGSGAPNGPNHTWRWDRAGSNIYLSSDQLPEAIVQP
jgi:hypothetical protein